MRAMRLFLLASALATAALTTASTPLTAQQTEKPPLHARHWIAVTGKPLAR